MVTLLVGSPHAKNSKPPADLVSAGGSVSGADGDRTHDLVTASHALSRLSYGPIFG